MPGNETLPAKLMTTRRDGVTDTLVTDGALTAVALPKLSDRSLSFCKLGLQLSFTAKIPLFLHCVQSKVFCKPGSLVYFSLELFEQFLRFLLVQHPFLLKSYGFVIQRLAQSLNRPLFLGECILHFIHGLLELLICV